MIKRWFSLLALSLILVPAGAGARQYPQGSQRNQFPVDDPVIKAMWTEGMENSQIYTLAQVLADSIGPRLPASPAYDAGADWVLKLFREWGLEGRKDEYGTWRAWERGVSHIDLIEPRVRTLDGIMQAWSVGTNGPVTGDAVIIPEMTSPGDLEAFLATVQGKFVLMNPGEPTCRPAADWEEWATPESLERIQALQDENRTLARERLQAVGINETELVQRLEAAGVAGVIYSTWTGSWGAYRVMAARNTGAPNVAMNCEDYGLLYRLAANGQGPVVRMDLQTRELGTGPTYNIIGEIRGTENPDEYIILSAHFDCWDGGSCATDNGSGTVTMLEAARILKEVYPNPKRTILVALWDGEEEGLNGSTAFVADHPEIVQNTQTVFNQDNGTGRVANISMQGFTGVAAYMGEWMTALSSGISQYIDLNIPGNPGSGGSDYSSFVCAGVPAFSLSSLSWSYRQTYHNPTDTFDKAVIDDLANNATLTAMLTYLASEEPDRLPRDTRVMGINSRTGEPGSWPQCREAARNADAYFRRGG